MVIVFLAVAAYLLSRPLQVVESYELMGSSRLMADAELDAILDRYGNQISTP
jgi:hypothetical protein